MPRLVAFFWLNSGWSSHLPGATPRSAALVLGDAHGLEAGAGANIIKLFFAATDAPVVNYGFIIEGLNNFVF